MRTGDYDAAPPIDVNYITIDSAIDQVYHVKNRSRSLELNAH